MERMTARVLRAPFTGRAARELLFCALGLVFGLAVFVIPPAFIALSFAVGGSVRGGGPRPAAIPAVRGTVRRIVHNPGGAHGTHPPGLGQQAGTIGTRSR